jgi:ubiquinone/menaquinone biosynthesis C-methylase UbiE
MDQRTPQELYTPGYTAAASDFMALRSAASHASFVLKYLRPTTRLLDGGCGPGSISCDLAASILALPTCGAQTSGGQTSGGGQITGIDREPSQIDQARQRAADRKLINIAFQTASIYALPFPDASFDIVFAHALFEHLNDPAAALREMHRVLVPGGLAAVRSPDWGGFLVVPELPGVQDALNVYAQRQTDNGGDIHVGRKLPMLMTEAGFKPIDFSAEYDCSQPPAAIADYLASTLPESHADAMQRWGQHPYATFAQSWCHIVAEKSTGASRQPITHASA